MKQPPRLLESPLTGQVYVVTRYTIKNAADGTPYLSAQIKYDVTEDFKAIAARWKRPRKSVAP